MDTDKYLICITTCQRSAAIKAFVNDYLKFCQSNPEADLLVSVDGADSATLRFLSKHCIPHLFSDEREGVGMSKNRVLSEFLQQYDYFFFIEDDVRLCNPAVFEKHIDAYKRLNIHHLTLFPADRVIAETKNVSDSGELLMCDYGGGTFGFYTREGLEKVGGFHSLFAKYKRFGHTEHTYRYLHAGLNSSPFVILKAAIDDVKYYHPMPATRLKTETDKKVRLFIGEKELIEQQLDFFPVTTISPYHVPLAPDKKDYKLPGFAKPSLLTFQLQMQLLNFLRKIKRIFVKR